MIVMVAAAEVITLFRKPLPYVKGGYTPIMTSDVLNMFLVALGGRKFALLNNNYSSRVPNDVAASRDEMYAVFISALDLNTHIYKKNLLVCARDSKQCRTLLVTDINIGQLLGYYEPRADGWENQAKRQAEFSLHFFDSRDVQIFGQNLTQAKTDNASLERYIKKNLRKLNQALSKLSLQAYYVINK